MTIPKIIQGGMGVSVSSWQLARAVSQHGQLGVVSGTGIDAVMARRLQLGDQGGHILQGLSAFPIGAIAERVWNRYFIPGGKRPSAPFKSKPIPSIHSPRTLVDLGVLSGFVEVHLAKRNHDGLVGINLMEKIQLPTLPILFGAMMAGVDFVLVGAGIPRFIPAALDRLSALETAALPIDVLGAEKGREYAVRFDPLEYCPKGHVLTRPRFLGIISSAVLAIALARRSTGRVDGFVVESQCAGGHNAPPRGAASFTSDGEPVYGPKDEPNLAAIRELGLPFWLAGGYGSPEGLNTALSLGAEGVQVGTAFAFCEESGLAPDIKAELIGRSIQGTVPVRTDPRASPTGFPFKVVEVPGSLSDQSVYARRERICDMGYLRQPFRRPDGAIGYRCPAEPIEDFIAKGGEPAETIGRKCLCNGLLAAAGFSQVRKDGYVEPPIVTSGDNLADITRFLQPGRMAYSAGDVIACILDGQVAALSSRAS